MRHILLQGLLVLLLIIPTQHVHSEVYGNASLSWSGGTTIALMCRTVSSDSTDMMVYEWGLYTHCALTTPNYGEINSWIQTPCQWPNPYSGGGFSCGGSGPWSMYFGQWKIEGWHYGVDEDYVLALHDSIPEYCGGSETSCTDSY